MTHLHDGVMRRRLPSWWWVLAVSGLLAGGLCGLVLAGTPLLARIELGRTLTRLAVHTGFEIRVERVRVDLGGLLVLESIRVQDWAGSGLSLYASRAQTRVHAGALLRGASGSADVEIEGLVVSADPTGGERRSGYSGVLRRLARLSADASGPLADPWRVTTSGARLEAGASETRGGWSARDFHVRAGRAAAGQPVTVELHGTLVLEDGPARIAAALGLSGERLSALTLELERPAALGLVEGISSRTVRLAGGAWTFGDVSAAVRLGGLTAGGRATALLVATESGGLPDTLADAARIEVWEPDFDLGELPAGQGSSRHEPVAATQVALHGAGLRAPLGAGILTVSGADVTAELERGRLTRVAGRGVVGLQGASIDAGVLDPSPVPLPHAEGPVTASWSLSAGLVVSAPELRIAGALVDAHVELTAGTSTFGLEIPDQPCTTLLRAVPPELLPRLGPLERATGTAGGRLRIVTRAGGEALVDSSGVFGCRLGPLALEREQRLLSVLRDDEALPERVRAWVVSTLDPTFDRHPGVRPPEPRELQRCAMPWCTLSLTERLAALADPPPDRTLASRVELAFEALRLEELGEKDRLLAAWAERVRAPGGAEQGLRSLVLQAVGRQLEVATALDIVFALALVDGAMGLEPPGSALAEPDRRALAVAMERLMRSGAITPEEFVAAAPYDPLAPR